MTNRLILAILAILAGLAATATATATSSTPATGAQALRVVQVRAVDAQGVGAELGEITISNSPHGLVFTPSLTGLKPGMHGFHLHENPSCEAGVKDGKPAAALAAGGHHDPDKSGRHGTPWGDGHRGDLPPLWVDAEGRASQPVLAPRLTMADLPGRALMLHAGGDNHDDHPQPMGGGGARLACGVLPAG